MQKYVFTIKDDVCAANGKDVEGTELLAKMKLWGDVEDYDAAVAAIRAEYETTIKNLTAQLTAIKDQELTNDEIELLNAYRTCKQGLSVVHQVRIVALETELEKIKADYQAKTARITELLAN